MAPEQIAVLTRPGTQGVPSVAFRFTPFMPTEAGDITGASAGYQRELRKRGVLKHTGHARFDVVSMASLMALRMLSERAKPSEAAEFAKAVGFGVAWHALLYRDGYSGDHDRTLLWDPELGPRIEAWQAATALIRNKSDWTEQEALAEVDRVVATGGDFNGWEAQATWLRTEIFNLRLAGNLVPMPRFALWLPNGEFVFRNFIDIAFKERQLIPILRTGPLVTIDQEHLGKLLLTNMKQVTGDTFVHVSFWDRK